MLEERGIHRGLVPTEAELFQRVAKLVERHGVGVVRHLGHPAHPTYVGSMLERLETVLAELPTLLASSEGWRGMRIDYHEPHVDRAWRPWHDCRLSIHRIHPCTQGAALLHPHPWPSAMQILAGRYEMSLGYAAGITAPPIAARFVLPAGTVYAMTDRDAWHDVRPLAEPVITVMLSGPPWDRAMPVEPEMPQGPLSPTELAELLATARRHLPRR
jgi:hypothetical protein